MTVLFVLEVEELPMSFIVSNVCSTFLKPFKPLKMSGKERHFQKVITVKISLELFPSLRQNFAHTRSVFITSLTNNGLMVTLKNREVKINLCYQFQTDDFNAR